jgi:thiol-disulfide isomerase/thioredoxin
LPGKIQVFTGGHKPEPLRAVLHSRARRHAVLLNIWEITCEPCRSELSELERIETERAGAVRVFGLIADDVSSDTRDAVERYVPVSLRSRQYVLVDNEAVGVLFPAFKSRQLSDLAVPLTALFDSDGKLVLTLIGSVQRNKENAERLKTALDGILAPHK